MFSEFFEPVFSTSHTFSLLVLFIVCFRNYLRTIAFTPKSECKIEGKIQVCISSVLSQDFRFQYSRFKYFKSSM